MGYLFRHLLISVLAGALAAVATSAQMLHVQIPNGGERFSPGDTVTVGWEGASEGVRLHYSTDEGVTWRYIGDRLTGGNYPWVVPATPSGHCIVRAAHIVPDSTVVLADSASNWLANALHNRDGTLALIWAEGVLSLWDAATSQLLWSRGGVGGGFRFSPDGTRVLAPVGANQSAILDARTGAVIKVVNGMGPTGYSEGGGFIYYFDYDRGTDYLVVMDANTFEVRWRFPYNEVRTFVATDANDNFIALTRNGFGTLVWSLRSGASLAALPYNGFGLAFNPDGSRLCLGVANGNAVIFDTLTWKATLTLHSDPTVIYSVQYSADGSKILVVYGDDPGTAKLWDAATGELLRTFLHMHYGRFSTDEHGIVAVNIYGDLVRYGIDRTTANDVSDGPFTIEQPRMAVRGSAYGEIGAPAVFRSRGSFALRNDSRVPVTIRRILLSGSDMAAFTMLPPSGLQKLLPGDSLVVKTTFLPGRVGDFQALALCVTETDTLSVPLTGTGVFLPLRPYIDTVRFGSMKHFAGRDSAIAILRNMDNVPWRVTLTLAPGADTVGFSLLNDGVEETVQPGEDLVAHVRFTALHENGAIYSRLTARYNGIGSDVRIALFGPGWLQYLEAPDDEAYPSGEPGLILYPNPARSAITVAYPAHVSDGGRMTVLDASGGTVGGIAGHLIEPGSTSMTIDLSGCSAGLYFVRMFVNDEVRTRPFIVVR